MNSIRNLISKLRDFANIRNLILLALLGITALTALIVPDPRALNPFSADFWLTPDQQGDRLMQRKEYALAAKCYKDPMRAGTASYRAGDFEAAVSSFQQRNTPESWFNIGNSLVMQGAYEDAIDAYDTALSKQPGWKNAETNREIARLRAERIKAEGGEMTGGKLKADEYIFTSGGNSKNGKEKESSDGGESLSDTALQQLWLRRVQTRPADFLKSKFACQAQREDAE